MVFYERLEKLRNEKGISQGDLEKQLKFSNGSISKWKKSKPTHDRLEKLADYFCVTSDFLIGKTDIVICPVCGFGNNPLSEQSRKEHEQFHNRFLAIKEKYPFFMKLSDADKLRNDSITNFRNPNRTIDERLNSFDDYLRADFSSEIARSNYEADHLNYEDFCKVEVGTLEVDWVISEELIDILIEKYGIDRNYMFGNEQILARTSNNPQLMRILSYAEKLNPAMLDALEIQIKALVESKK